MRTSSPDHLYLSLDNPYVASVQLFYTLIGRYHVMRRSQHTAIIDNKVYPPHLLRHPTAGYCDISLRASTDPYYEVELIQSTTMTYETLHHNRASTIETRCFRIKDGVWSVWAMEEMAPGRHQVGAKLADLQLWDIPRPCATVRGDLQVVNLSTMRGSGYEDFGRNFIMTVWLGQWPCWQMKSQAGFLLNGGELFHDEYSPITD